MGCRRLGLRSRSQAELDPATTLGNAAAARVRLIVGCLYCRYQAEPDPATLAQQHGAETLVRDRQDRLFCSRCGSHGIDMVVTGEWQEAG